MERMDAPLRGASHDKIAGSSQSVRAPRKIARPLSLPLKHDLTGNLRARRGKDIQMRLELVARRCAQYAGNAALSALLWCGAGCLGGRDVSVLDADLTPMDSVAATGTLQLPLTAASPSGAAYRLRNAHFAITNPFVEPPVETVVSGDSDVLSVELPLSAFAFDYTIALQDGWALVEIGPDGKDHQVAATLDGASAQSFTIKSARVTPITYQFVAEGTRIGTGTGSVAVRVTVDDTAIDDFEDGDGDLIPIAGRNGSWFTFNDGTGIETPAPDSPVLPEVLDASANSVLHVTGQNFSPAVALPDGGFAFGAGVGVLLRVDPENQRALPYDASGYDGMRFDTTTSFPATTQLRLSFLVATSATTPVEEGGTCSTGCSDDFGIFGVLPFSPFSFSSSFSWDQLTQQGFGTPVAFDPKTILAFKWIVAFPDAGQGASANDFDLQLDNMSFTAPVSSAPPAAPPPAMSGAPEVPAPPGSSWAELAR